MPPGNEKIVSFGPWSLSDQRLLDGILDEKQSAIFKKAYPNIFSRQNF